MNKSLILLAVSRKYSRYCVAGVDTTSGKLVRLITKDSDAHYAVTEQDLTFLDGTRATKLDIVQVEIEDRSVSYYQSENYVLRKGVVWRKAGIATIADAIALHPLNRPEYAFYDTKRKLHKDFFRTIEPRQISSLMLIRPQNTILLIQESFDRRQVLFDFSYNGRQYEPFPITDPDYTESVRIIPAGDYPMNSDPILLISVGECFPQDNCHYKLAAGVFQCDQPSF